MRTVLTVFVVFFAAACTGDAPKTDTESLTTNEGKLGTVQLESSCSAEAATHLQSGLALLHHMTYEQAESSFAEAASVDPTCAMAYWGQAMTYIHPLWHDPPSEEVFARGASLLDRARGMSELTDVETSFIEAASTYYQSDWSADEAPRLQRFADGWRASYDRLQGHPEAASFFALATLGTVDPADKTYEKQKFTSEIALGVLEAIPDHPGAHHYVIHANDYPPLAENALPVARTYGDIAPAIPHALHMPSHIFTRLGLWEESISWNDRSAQAARSMPAGDAISLHYLHAIDYLAYAYLQQARDEKAAEVLAELQSLTGPFQTHLASAYTMAAVPARLALERHAWDEASSLVPRTPDVYPWDGAPAQEAITYFARALGAARSGKSDQAKSDLERLAELRDRIPPASAYWATQVEIQRLSALAWLQLASGDSTLALETMQSAADLESSTEKHPVTPGEILPARELLGDMLLEAGRADEALAAYQEALHRSPGRFNSLLGAGMASAKRDDPGTAKVFFGELLEIASESEGGRTALREASDYVRDH